MARIAEPGLLERIVDAATMAFIKRGYRGCRVEEVAERAEVSVGTVYRYVCGKEALFELVVQHAFGELDVAEVSVPFRGSAGLDFVDELWRRLLATHPARLLREAVERGPSADAAEELEAIVRDLYRWEHTYWKGLLLIERCARDWPELDMLFYRQFRREALGLGARYIEAGIESGDFVAVPDVRIASRFVGETVAFFALHRHTAPDSQDMDETLVEETVVAMVRNALVGAARRVEA